MLGASGNVIRPPDILPGDTSVNTPAFEIMMGTVITHFEQQKKMINSTLRTLQEFSARAKSSTNSQTFTPVLVSLAETTEKQAKKRLRKMKKKTDPNRPKRPPSGYQLFMAVHSGTYKEEHPEVDQKDVMTVIAKRWSDADATEKDVFQQQAITLKIEYETKVKEYEASIMEQNGGILPDMNKLSPEEIELRRALKKQRKEQRQIREKLLAEQPEGENTVADIPPPPAPELVVQNKTEKKSKKQKKDH